MYHELKITKRWLQALGEHDKGFEIRKHDRSYQIGDELYLREWDEDSGRYTGPGAVCTIIDIDQKVPGLEHGYLLLWVGSVKPCIIDLHIEIPNRPAELA
jgi:hypothetical protein